MTYEQFKAARSIVERAMRQASDELNSFPKNTMGLTPDSVKASLAFKAANAAYKREFETLRALNATYLKKFAKEIRAERRKEQAA